MRIMIHACPGRLWYVQEFLMPQLLRQGAAEHDVTVWLDAERKGNLRSCMESFAACDGDGDTWHLQDDVLPSWDFVRLIHRAEGLSGIVCGFVNEIGGPDANLVGFQKAKDLWYSFPCIRIPDARARSFAAWLRAGADGGTQAREYFTRGVGDDWFFKRYLEMYCPEETVYHCKPCLVQHVDYLLGGSLCSPYRGYYTPAAYWDDEEAEEELKQAIKTRAAAVSDSGTAGDGR